MAYWNHFSDRVYKRILFSDLQIGQEFRNNFWKGKRRRADILCIKTSELTYIEKKSKKEHKLLTAENYEVSSSTEKLKQEDQLI